MSRVLEGWGFDCHALVGGEATRERILEALRQLRDTARPNDAIVIYYSGHGGRYRVEGGEGVAPTLEYLVPVDYDPSAGLRGILSVELSQLVGDVAARVESVTVVLDCCHVTTPAPDPSVERIRSIPERRVKVDQFPTWSESTEAKLPPNVLRLLAAAPGSPAFEFSHGGSASGYFTTALCEVLEPLIEAPTPNAWAAVIVRVRERISARRHSSSQRPEVVGTHDRPLRQPEPVDPSVAAAGVPHEDELFEGAARAIEAAIADLHHRGIATAHLIDGRFVRIYPDGRSEDLGAGDHS